MTEKEREKIYQEMKAQIAQATNRVDHFWEHSYPFLTAEGKLRVWSRYLFKLLRWNGETMEEQLGMFTEENYKVWKERETQIDKMLDELIPKISEYLGGGYEQEINDRLCRNKIT